MSKQRTDERVNDLVRRLAQAPVFSRLSESERLELARRTARREHRKGEFIFHQGDTWPFVMYVGAGRLEWSIVSFDGKRQALFDVGAGGVVWGHSFFDDQPMPADMEVLETSLVYKWDRESLIPILSQSTEALWELVRTLIGAMRRVREIVYGFAFQKVAGRLARLLLSQYPFEEGRPIRRDMTLDEMAAHVGSTPALVCKTLYEFAEKGMIRITRTEFEFVDRDELERVALGDRRLT